MATNSAAEMNDSSDERVKVVAVVGATVVAFAAIITCATESMAFLNNPPW